MDAKSSSEFYEQLPVLASFGDASNLNNYAPLPADWLIGVADIAGSTKAVEAGKYKTINMIGAAVISAQINVSRERRFPFVFGGDGSTFAIPPEQERESRQQLAAVKRWAHDEFGIELRVALIPVREIRTSGNSVSVARFAASADVDYAMFRGGGVQWAEARMKAGKTEIDSAPEGSFPDLTGLSCRWQSMKAKYGAIVSLVLVPVDRRKTARFDRFTQKLIALVEAIDGGGRPVPDSGPGVGWPPEGLALEAHASHRGRSLLATKAKLLLETFLVWLLFKSGMKLGQFDPSHYQSTSGNNSDFRKFEDGLKMTIDCSEADYQKLVALLDQAEKDDIVRYGVYRQESSIMTCIVPSVMSDDHFHFIDGADGGYTMAATMLKPKLAGTQ